MTVLSPEGRTAALFAFRTMSKRDTSGQLKKRNQQAFLAAYRETGNVRRACEAAGVGRSSHYRWLTEEEGYRTSFQDAQDDAVDLLEEEARRRAVEGVEEPVGWYQGSPGGTVLKYSDTLLMFLLKGIRPEKYRERVEHSGDAGAPIAIHVIGPKG